MNERQEQKECAAAHLLGCGFASKISMLRHALQTQNNQPASFCVDAVLPADQPLWTEPLATHIAKRFSRKLLLTPQAEKLVANTQASAFQRGKLSDEMKSRMMYDAVDRCHPLIDAVHTAFSEHRPLTLSPDCIWMVIEQSFAHHVTENAESLRDRLVRHQERTRLSADVQELSLTGFAGAISSFSSQIRDATNPILHEALLCDFSTTTPVIRTASEVVLMDCYASYFDYFAMSGCGIPKVTVLGSIEDWQRMRARVEVLETFGLTRWVSRVRPILDEFIRTVEGHPSVEFWQAIVKPKQAYRTTSITGWIADLFLYLDGPQNRHLNNILKYEREDWIVPSPAGVPTGGMGVDRKSFPAGLSSVPVNLTLPNGLAYDVDFVGGFVAVEQDPEDLALSPVISWCIADRTPTISRLLYT